MEKTAELYLKQIEDYCNVLFDRNDIPAGVQLALDELLRIDPLQYSITSEKLSDMAVTYSDNNGQIPKYILNWLAPYRRIFLSGNKKKKKYDRR